MGPAGDDSGAQEGFPHKSQLLHESHYAEFASTGPKQKEADAWLANDTVYAWRHRRMYDCLLPLIEAAKGSDWLTIGDGKIGSDARYLIEHGCPALPTDISDILLQEAKKNGLIPDYRKENAEALSFADGSFDYVLCKNSYHHFPRPMLAFYEMLRVARRAIVLIEPDDHYVNEKLAELAFRRVKDLFRRLGRKESQQHVFEPVGNYVYSLSRREVEKAALGLNLKYVAFGGVNDHYLPGGETARIGENTPQEKKTRRMIKLQDLACRLGLKRPRAIVAVVFKETPGQRLMESLRKEGFELRILPDNPYLAP